MEFTEEQKDIRDDAVQELSIYFEDVKKSTNFEDLKGNLQALIDECENWMYEIDSLNDREEN